MKNINGESKKGTILVADDEPSIRMLLKGFFAEYEVFEAENGVEALKLGRSCKPDLVFLDIMMPELDGYGVLHKLKSDIATKQIPVIILTGLNFGLNAQLSQNLGADAYITKPFTAKQLTDIVNRFYGKS